MAMVWYFVWSPVGIVKLIFNESEEFIAQLADDFPECIYFQAMLVC